MSVDLKYAINSAEAYYEALVEDLTNYEGEDIGDREIDNGYLPDGSTFGFTMDDFRELIVAAKHHYPDGAK